MQRKPKFRVLGDIFCLAYVVKYVFGRYVTSSGRYLGLVDLATLIIHRRQKEIVAALVEVEFFNREF